MRGRFAQDSLQIVPDWRPRDLINVTQNVFEPLFAELSLGLTGVEQVKIRQSIL